MDISYLSKSAIPSKKANSVQVMKMCSAFALLGHDVTLYAPKYNDDPADINEVFDHYGIAEEFEIKWIGTEKADRYTYPFYCLREVKRTDPDLVYGRAIGGCFVASLARYKTIYEIHHPPSSKLKQLLFDAMCRNRHLSCVAISGKLRDHLLANYPLQQSNVCVAHDGAEQPPDETDNEQKNTDYYVDSYLNAGYVGQLYPGKGMEMIAKLVRRCPDIFFHIVGGDEESVSSWRDELEDVSNVQFHGFVSHADTAKYRAGMDVLLAPYQDEVLVGRGTDVSNWMSPLKIFEYMSSGTPMLASDLPVLKEVLEHRTNALLCDPSDVNDWVEKLNYAKKNEREMRDIGHKAKLDMAENFTWEKRARKILCTLVD